jgi:hypothetical protein
MTLPGLFRFTSDQKEGLTGVSGVTITTYTMIAFSGKRSEESARVMDQIRSREWGLLLMDEVHVVPAQMFRKVTIILLDFVPSSKIQKFKVCMLQACLPSCHLTGAGDHWLHSRADNMPVHQPVEQLVCICSYTCCKLLLRYRSLAL